MVQRFLCVCECAGHYVSTSNEMKIILAIISHFSNFNWKNIHGRRIVSAAKLRSLLTRSSVVGNDDKFEMDTPFFGYMSPSIVRTIRKSTEAIEILSICVCRMSPHNSILNHTDYGMMSGSFLL